MDTELNNGEMAEEHSEAGWMKRNGGKEKHREKERGGFEKNRNREKEKENRKERESKRNDSSEHSKKKPGSIVLQSMTNECLTSFVFPPGDGVFGAWNVNSRNI